jgi:predicted DNA-binding transcriptional regulator YafY
VSINVTHEVRRARNNIRVKDMKNRLTRLLKVLERCPRSGAPDVDALALQLHATPETIRRDLRDLREAGAFDGLHLPAAPANDIAAAPPGEAAPTDALPHAPANDGARSHPLALGDDEFVAMYVGARFLAAEGDTAAADAAQRLINRIERAATPELLHRLAELDARYRFGPRANERKIRQLVAQAIAERRVLAIRYRGENDESFVTRHVEPLAQFFIHDRWSFIAFCRTRNDFRQFRHERCQHVELLEEYFTPRGGFSLESFIERRRAQATRAAAAAPSTPAVAAPARAQAGGGVR